MTATIEVTNTTKTITLQRGGRKVVSTFAYLTPSGTWTYFIDEKVDSILFQLGRAKAGDRERLAKRMRAA